VLQIPPRKLIRRIRRYGFRQHLLSLREATGLTEAPTQIAQQLRVLRIESQRSGRRSDRLVVQTSMSGTAPNALVECRNSGKPSDGGTVEIQTVSILPALDEEIAGVIDDVAQIGGAFRKGKEGVKELSPPRFPAALVLDSTQAKDRGSEAWIQR
jgi:hypothetical protein